MTTPTVRCLWREMRLSQSFWIAVLILAIGLQVFIRLLDSVWLHEAEQAAQLIQVLAWLMPLVYLVGIAGSSFSRDDESGMARTIRTLPLSWQPLWIAKMVFALSSCVAMLLLLQLITRATGFVLDRSISPADFAYRWTSVLLATLGVATLTSTLVRRPLVSTFMSGAILFAVFGPWTFHAPLDRGNRLRDVEPNYFLYLLIGVTTILISAATTWRWLRFESHPHSLTQLRQRLRRILTWASRMPAADTASPVRWYDLAGRFAWISLRSQGNIILMLGLLSVPILAVLALLLSSDGLMVLIPHLAFSWPPLVGGTLYAPEQRPSHRQFLAERGVTGRQVWWLRSGLVTGILLLIASVVCVTWFSMLVRNEPQQPRDLAKAYTVYCLVAFAASQYFSLVFTSPLIAATASFSAAVVTAAWCVFGAAFSLPAYVQLTPMIGFLLGSWWRADAWLVQRNQWSHWAIAIATPLVGLVLITYPVLYWHRVSVPGYSSALRDRADDWTVDLSSANALAREQKQALQQAANYAEAVWPARFDGLDADWGDLRSERANGPGETTDSEIVVPWPQANARRQQTLREMETWLQENKEGIFTPEVMAAIGSDAVIDRPVENWFYSEWPKRYANLARCFVLRAVVATEHGDLAGAESNFRNALSLLSKLRANSGWDEWIWSLGIDGILCEELLIWASAPGQTAEAVEDMARHLGDLVTRQPSPVLATRVDFTRKRWGAARLPDSIEDATQLDEEALYALHLMPGETTRIQRLVDVSYDSVLRELTRPRASPSVVTGELPSLANNGYDDWYYPPFNTTVLFPQVFSPAYLPGALATRIGIEERQRATVIRLYLVAARLRDGHYPLRVSLDQLPFVDVAHRVCRFSPQTGTPFQYAPVSSDSEQRLQLVPLITGTALVDAPGYWAVTTYNEIYLLPVDERNQVRGELKLESAPAEQDPAPEPVPDDLTPAPDKVGAS